MSLEDEPYGSDHRPVPQGPLQRIIEFVGGYATAAAFMLDVPSDVSNKIGYLSCDAQNVEGVAENQTGYENYAVGYSATGGVANGGWNHEMAAVTRRWSPTFLGDPNVQDIDSFELPTPEKWETVDLWYLGNGGTDVSVINTRIKTIMINCKRLRNKEIFNPIFSRRNKLRLILPNFNIGIGNNGFTFKAWKGTGNWRQVGENGEVEWASDAEVPVRLEEHRFYGQGTFPTQQIDYDMRKEATYSPDNESRP